jgi:diguanylate cyclase (GGDEF)-like protein/PAS domain S-box-containing protein
MKEIKYRSFALIVALLYLGISIIWILISDQILLLFIGNLSNLSDYQSIKGILFVLVTAILLFVFISIRLKKIEKKYRMTLEAAGKNENEFNSLNQFVTSFIDDAAEPILFFDEDYKVTKVNASFERMFGWDHQELLHKEVKELMPYNVEEEYKHIKNVLSNGIPISNYETKRKRKNGEIMDVSVSISPLLNNQKEVTGYSSTYQNISNKKKTEQYLLEVEERFRIMSKYSRDLIKIVDLQGNVIYASPSHKKLLRMENEGFHHKSIYLFIHQDDIANVKEMIDEAFIDKKSHFVEYRIQNHKKEWVWMESNITPTVNNGKVENIIFVERNISDRKERERLLKKMAFVDSLTNIGNRRMLKEKIIELTSKPSKFVLIIIDCDNFKVVNDEYGHDIGDQLLKTIVTRIKENIREKDLLTRLGGDEFALLLQDIDDEREMENIANNILHSFEEPIQYGAVNIETTISMGGAMYPNHGHDVRELMKKADKALYQVKDNGKNSYKLYTEIQNISDVR